MISSHLKISYLHMLGYHIVFINLLPLGIPLTFIMVIQWTEWSTIWSEITSMISDQNCTTRSSIAVVKFSTQWLFAFHFPEILLITLNEPWNLIGCFVLLSHSHRLRKRCDLEHKMVRLVNKSHLWELIRLQRNPVISKWI